MTDPQHRPDQLEQQIADMEATATREGRPQTHGGKPRPSAAAVYEGPDDADDQDHEDQEDHEGRERFSFQRWLRKSPPVLVSSLVHAAAMIILGSMMLTMPAKEMRGVVLDSVSAPEEESYLEELADVELETQELPELEDISVAITEPDPGMISFSDVAPAVTAVAASDAGDIQLEATTIGEIGALFGEDGKGMADSGEGVTANASFFGAKSTGSRFVFVVDNSNSMGRGKFETVVEELVRSVNKLTPKQRFYVYFFSDAAYPLFHPNPPYGMVRATPENKQKLKVWLYNVEMCLRTKGREAMERALAMRPDAIYVLGDGAFTDDTAKMLTAPHDRFTVIHTIGMQVNDRGRKELQAIAKANKGSFRSAQPSPTARAMAKASPIKRNNSYGPIWGFELPKRRKK